MADIRRCRRCGELFVPGMFGLNLLVVRIRRCGVCGKMTPLFIWGDAPDDGRGSAATGGEESVPMNEDEVLKRRMDESRYERH